MYTSQLFRWLWSMEDLWVVLFRNDLDEVKMKSHWLAASTEANIITLHPQSSHTVCLEGFICYHLNRFLFSFFPLRRKWMGFILPEPDCFPLLAWNFNSPPPPPRTDIIFHLMCFPFLMSHDVNNEKCLKMKDDIKEAVWGAEGQCWYDSGSITWNIMIDKRAIIHLLFPFLPSRLWDLL